MKNVSRNKFLLCFRPVVDMDIMLESKGVLDGSASQGLQYVSVENKEETKETKALMTPKRSFSRLVKAVMFDTILTKRVRDRKNSYRSKRSLLTNSERSIDKLVNRASVDGNIQEMKTNSGLLQSSSFGSYWSSSTCSSPISESKNLSKSLSDITKQNRDMNHQDLVVKPKKVDMGNRSSFNSGIYLFVISLIITILWGRVCAILFTSIWVYFLPRRHAGYDRQVSVIKLGKTDSRDDKKRVIMEGLLERNHHRGH